MAKLIATLLIFITGLAANASDGFSICRYAFIGDAAKIRPYLKKTIINTKCDNDMTPLLWAAYNDHDAVVKLMIKNGADINAKSKSGRTALTYAISNDNPVMAQYLLSNGAKITDYEGIDQIYDSADKNGGRLFHLLAQRIKDPDKTYEIESDYKWSDTETTILMRLAANGNLDSVKRLVQMGADINKPNSRGETPLLAALRGRKTDIAEYLLSIGAKADAKDIQGNSLLTYAIKINRPDLAVRALDAGISADDSVGCGVMKNEYQKEHWVKPAGDEYNQQCSYLHMAAAYGNIPIADELLKHGADLNEKSTEFLRRDALGYAAYNGKTDMLKFLMSKGANPYVKYYNRHDQGDIGLYYIALASSKYTLLSLAAMSLHPGKEMTDYLLSLPGAAWYAENETEYFYINIKIMADAEDKDAYFPWLLKKVDAMNFALKPAALKVLAMIDMNLPQKNSAAEKKPRTLDDDFDDAVEAGDIDAVKKYIADGYDIKTRAPDAAFSAYTEDRYDMVRFLLDNGLDINRHYQGKETNNTLLLWHQYLTDGQASFVIELLDRGADINQTVLGHNLLEQSIGYNNSKFQRELTTRGAEFICDPSVLAALTENNQDNSFLDNDAVKAPREKLYRCVDLSDALITLIKDAVKYGRPNGSDGAYRLMLEAYRLGIRVDYAKVTAWLNKNGTYKAYDNAKIAVRYFSGIE